MGWAETAREERRAPIGEYEPERYRVVVYDTFEQYRLRMMTAVLSNSMTVPELFLFCAEYVLDHHRKLKHLRTVFRKGAREICTACRDATPERKACCRREELNRFCEWAGPEIRRREGER